MRTTIAMLSLLVLTGCASLDRIGRAGSGIAGLFAPEYKASFDNVLSMLQDDQLFQHVDFYVVTPDGRRYDVSEVRIGARPVEPTWSLTEVPPGVMRRIAKQPLPPEVEDQRQLLIDALKQLPTKEE